MPNCELKNVFASGVCTRPPWPKAVKSRWASASLGTVSESYHYDRIENRDKPAPERPKRPWEKAGVPIAAVAKKSPA